MTNKFRPVNIRTPCYAMASADGITAELTLYGEIVESQPYDWWTGEPIEGDYIIQSEFLDDLETISGCRSLNIRINSYGGDAGVSLLIHNRLKELRDKGVKVTCVVDGVAMSGGSLIMCACESVEVYPASLVMIHKAWGFIYGRYNADQLRAQAKQNDAWDAAQISVYKGKTNLSETVISHMMSETTYMTGEEAVEKGFADRLAEGSGSVPIAASADGSCLFAGSRLLHLGPGMTPPERIPRKEKATSGENTPVANNEPVNSGRKAGLSMNESELREKYPELVAGIETAAVQSARTGEADRINAAVVAERERLHGIDEIAAQIPDDMLAEAKYGENRCSAQELAFRVMKANQQKGADFLSAMKKDAKASGAADVKPINPPADKPDAGAPKTQKEKMKEAEAYWKTVGASAGKEDE